MRVFPSFLMILLIALLFAACGEHGNPMAPSGPVTGPSQPIDPYAETAALWTQLPEDVRAYLLANFDHNGEHGVLKKFADSVITVYAEEVDRAATAAAIDFLVKETDHLQLQLVATEAGSRIRIRASWPPPNLSGDPNASCGGGGPGYFQGSPVLEVGEIYLNRGRSTCSDFARTIAHEILHVLGLAVHTPAQLDLFSEAGGLRLFTMSDMLRKTIDFLYNPAVKAGFRPD